MDIGPGQLATAGVSLCATFPRSQPAFSSLVSPSRYVAAVGALPLSFPGFAAIGRLCQAEENELFAGQGADVVVQAGDLDAGDLLDHAFQDRPGRLDELGPHLLEQVAAL